MAKSVKSPGDVFKSFLDEYHITPAKAAEGIQLSQSSIRLLINNKLPIAVHIALRLAKYFGNTPAYWINLQNEYELVEAAKDAKLAGILKGIQKAKKEALPPKKIAPAKKPGKAGAKLAAKKPAKAAAKKSAPRAKKTAVVK
jgi:addiction module HigA family antidote